MSEHRKRPGERSVAGFGDIFIYVTAMKIEQRQWHSTNGWKEVGQGDLQQYSANLVLAFGSTEALSDPNRYHELKSFYPNANIVTCSTAGEILGSKVMDNTIVATAI